MEVLAIVISGIALFVAVGHLFWNVFVWHAGGPRVQVEATSAPLELDSIRVELMALLARNALSS